MKKNLSVIVTLLVLDALIFYLALPVISINNPGLWFIIFINLIAAIVMVGILEREYNRKLKTLLMCAGIALLIIIGGAISGSRMFNAARYSRILDISVKDDLSLPTVKDLNKIPLMDTESSKVLGDRKIGALNEIVSQFEVSSGYMTIAYKDEPVKVSPLKYAGIWKWVNNRSAGIPGYIIVRPNDLTADYVKLSEGMKYVPSAYFSEDLARHIYFRYPTVFFENVHFEIDESGKPFFVASTYHRAIGLFGGKTIDGAIVVDPCSGEVTRYALSEIPSWVDIVYHGDYVSNYFDIYGKLINGFWNSLFGQKGLVESTTTTTYDSSGESSRDHDFGYIVRNNDVYIFTGITAVTNDESNIGYLMANERTGKVEIAYFESTDEDSVMRAAEGEVQEKGYRASFPSLIDINGTSAYAMVLKDNLGLVKMYAIVDAQQYSHMVVADTMEKAISQFTSGQISISDFSEKEITIRRIELITENGNTYVYIVDENNDIYHAVFEKEMLLLNEGDTLTILTDGNQFTLKK